MTTPAPAPSAWRSILLNLVVDVVPSILVFYVLRAFGISDVLAYLAGSVVPLARLIADRLRGRPFNAISGLILIFLVVSMVLALVTHDARAVIARGGLIYLALAVAAAVSVPTRSPLILLIARYFTIRNRPDAAPRFNAVSRQPRGLRAMRILTVLWAVAFGVSALACVAFAYTLPVTVSAAATSLVEPVMALLVAVGTGRYMRRSLAPLFKAAATPSSDPSQPPAGTFEGGSDTPITRQ
ncbi:hypothetical protein OG372_28715 [Streptomyces sp. NBC_01020]|uniref:VC0807 family protein n=1 Tax=unclassified Streptomyces TaxID=2593676 RepID=UPI002E1DA374|nr:hypothetical protein OG372_28715 [Streptomyces sp. NBC_01020]WSX66636.1 hypothetical protein OG221_08415 [Streptomyces sp. NBC_00932]